MQRRLIPLTLMMGVTAVSSVYAQQPNTGLEKQASQSNLQKSHLDAARQHSSRLSQAGNEGAHKQKTDGETDIGPASGAYGGNVQHPKW
jgi:hypothetical protein